MFLVETVMDGFCCPLVLEYWQYLVFSIQPRPAGVDVLVIAGRVIPKQRALICCCNSLHSSGKVFCKIWDPGCRDLLSEVQHLRWGEETWLTVGVPVHPKGVGWGWGQGSVQASQVLPHQTGKTISLWTWLYALGRCHAETGKDQTQTADANLEEDYCLKY